jgi:prepilin-type N-terminal cleavage/methylation domain-containing protein
LSAKRLLTEKKGVTLVEVIITLLIAGILIAASSGLIIAGMNLVSNTANKTMDENIAEAVLDLASKRLYYAPVITASAITTGEIPQGALDGGNTVIYVGDDAGKAIPKGMIRLKRYDAAAGDNLNIFGDAFYHGRSVSLLYTVDKVVQDEPKAVTLTVIVYDSEGKQTQKRTTSLQLLNADTTGAAAMRPPTSGDTGKTYPENPESEALALEIAEQGN